MVTKTQVLEASIAKLHERLHDGSLKRDFRRQWPKGIRLIKGDEVVFTYKINVYIKGPKAMAVRSESSAV